ncbi:hypothetical protein I4U23_009271 [Adineta vaga]|nr:hypothetical protein I4U23_009271 [Adineta vaga]
MLYSIFVIIALLLPQYVQSSCCHLPFTNGECQVRREGTHRYQIMPDRRSGLVKESTECFINDFDANYRKVVESKNYCNDCPGLLILHTNSSEIFLFPEYLERILEGRTPMQRKNVIILTTALVGAYDLDFTFLSRYYTTRSIADVPSIYVDLQLPVFDAKLEHQPTLRLRLPIYDDDTEGTAKISRQELINPLDASELTTTNVHQLPYLYHFDIEKHRHAPDQCSINSVQVLSTSLDWKALETGASTCHSYMSFLGRNRCLATGFTRLFCPVEESISTDEILLLSPYVQPTNRVEHLTVAVTGGRHIEMALSNRQLSPAQQVKILLLQGHLAVTDINLNLSIRVEYGWNCNDFSLSVPAGFSATRYRRFDGENLPLYEGNSVVTLPICFRVISNGGQVAAIQNAPLVQSPPSGPHPGNPIEEPESIEDLPIISKPDTISNLNVANETTIEGEEVEENENFILHYWNIIRSDNNLVYTIIVLIVLVALIPLCLGVFYRIYCGQHRKSNWTLEHGAHTNPAYIKSKDELSNVSVHSHVNTSTQTTDTPIRI